MIQSALTAVLAVCPSISPENANRLAVVVAYAADVSYQRPSLIAALMFRESTCDADAVNATTGALGLFQVMPSTAASVILGKHAHRKRLKLRSETVLDPSLNAFLGATVLKRAVRKCRGNIAGALSVYNGQGRCQASDFSDDVLATEAKVPGES